MRILIASVPLVGLIACGEVQEEIKEADIERTCENYCEQRNTCDDGTDVSDCTDECIESLNDCQSDEQEEVIAQMKDCGEESCDDIDECTIDAGAECYFGID